MRNSIIFSFFLMMCLSVLAQGSGTRGVSTPDATVSIQDKEYDFGNITEGTKVSHTFYLTNLGSTDIYIMDIETGCNCTASDYTLDAVKKGEKTPIHVVFDSDTKVGTQLKKIIVKTDKGSITCKMYGTVFPKNKNY